MAISDLVSAVVDKPVAAAARLVRRALERIPSPVTEGKAEAVPRKSKRSKGWRKHVRRAKSRQQSVQR